MSKCGGMHVNRCGYAYVCAQSCTCRHASMTLRFEHHGYAYACLGNYACMCMGINKGRDRMIKTQAL